ncbi:MAG TPA: hypothetical protein VKK81_27970 [Candidatus Binatia bacterium]|nr:hypothetical protein [Candidatus Binatia bacterium]
MKKLLLASVCLVATPALAGIDPVGCYAVSQTPQYMAKHPNLQLSSVRFKVTKPTKDHRQFWAWSFWIDVIPRGSDEILSSSGGCDLTRESDKNPKLPTSLRCYLDPENQGSDSRVIFTPHGADSNLWWIDYLSFGTKKVGINNEGQTIKIEQLDDYVCEGMSGKAPDVGPAMPRPGWLYPEDNKR